MTPQRPSTTPQPWPLVAVAGWVLPGLAHFLIGEVRRGVIVGVTLIALFTAGLMIGGVDVIDRQEQTLWFAGQVLVGPVTFGLDAWHQHLKQELDHQLDPTRTLSRDDTEERNRRLYHLLASTTPPAYRHSLGRVNELGTLYCTLAGVLNLLAILDAVGRVTAEPAEDDAPATDPATPGGPA